MPCFIVWRQSSRQNRMYCPSEGEDTAHSNAKYHFFKSEAWAVSSRYSGESQRGLISSKAHARGFDREDEANDTNVKKAFWLDTTMQPLCVFC